MNPAQPSIRLLSSPEADMINTGKGNENSKKRENAKQKI